MRNDLHHSQVTTASHTRLAMHVFVAWCCETPDISLEEFPRPNTVRLYHGDAGIAQTRLILESFLLYVVRGTVQPSLGVEVDE